MAESIDRKARLRGSMGRQNQAAPAAAAAPQFDRRRGAAAGGGPTALARRALYICIPAYTNECTLW